MLFLLKCMYIWHFLPHFIYVLTKYFKSGTAGEVLKFLYLNWNWKKDEWKTKARFVSVSLAFCLIEWKQKIFLAWYRFNILKYLRKKVCPHSIGIIRPQCQMNEWQTKDSNKLFKRFPRIVYKMKIKNLTIMMWI